MDEVTVIDALAECEAILRGVEGVLALRARGVQDDKEIDLLLCEAVGAQADVLRGICELLGG